MKKKFDDLESLFLDLIIFNGSYFVPSDKVKSSQLPEFSNRVIQPLKNIFFNIPYFSGGWTDLLSLYLSNAFFIIGNSRSIYFFYLGKILV
jgi:hypothetical protein